MYFVPIFALLFLLPEENPEMSSSKEDLLSSQLQWPGDKISAGKKI